MKFSPRLIWICLLFGQLSCVEEPLEVQETFAIVRKAALQEKSLDSIPERLHARLIASASREPWVDPNDIEWSIIKQYPNDAISVLLLKERVSDAEGLEVEPQDWIELALKEFPDSTVRCYAVRTDIERLRATGTADEFLSVCATWIENSSSPRASAIATYARMKYLADTGDQKGSALDSLRLKALHPDIVYSMELDNYIAARLWDAGLFLEAVLLNGQADAEVAKILWWEFSRLNEESEDRGWRYWNDGAHSFAQNWNANDYIDDFEGFLFQARSAVAWRQAYDIHRSFNSYEQLTQRVGVLLSAPVPLGTEQLRLVEAVLVEATTALQLAFLNSELMKAFLEPAQRAEMPDWPTLVVELGSQALRVAFRWRSGDTLNTRIDSHLDMLIELERSTDFIDTLDLLAERLPDRAAEFRFRQGEFARSELQSPRYAIGLFEGILEEFPSSPFDWSARLKLANAYMDLQKFDDCYSLLQDSLIRYDTNKSKVAQLQYLSGMCENAMGLADDAARRMESIVRSHSDAAVTPLALFWLAQHALSNRQYENAREYLEDLIRRYPDCPRAEAAREMMVGI